MFSQADYPARTPGDENLTPAAAAADVADALTFAGSFQGRKRVHTADEFMSVIVAERLVEHLERSGLVIMKKPRFAKAAPSDASEDDRRWFKANGTAPRPCWRNLSVALSMGFLAETDLSSSTITGPCAAARRRSSSLGRPGSRDGGAEFQRFSVVGPQRSAPGLGRCGNGV